jgi:hypothetical protein
MAWKDRLASPAAVAVIAGLSAAIGAVGGPYVTSRVDYFTRNREMDIKMVEIAVGILRTDNLKEPGVAPTAESAADLLEASFFRSFAAVNGARYARRLRRSKTIDGGKTSEVHASMMGWTAPRTASACQDGRCRNPI